MAEYAAGELRRPLSEKPEPGAWYFDPRDVTLVYVAHIGDRLRLDPAAGSEEIRSRARLLRDRVPVAGAQSKASPAGP